MSKETQVKNGASTSQATPAPTVSSGDQQFDQFVQQALQIVVKPKK